MPAGDALHVQLGPRGRARPIVALIGVRSVSQDRTGYVGPVPMLIICAVISSLALCPCRPRRRPPERIGISNPSSKRRVNCARIDRIAAGDACTLTRDVQAGIHHTYDYSIPGQAVQSPSHVRPIPDPIDIHDLRSFTVHELVRINGLYPLDIILVYQPIHFVLARYYCGESLREEIPNLNFLFQ